MEIAVHRFESSVVCTAWALVLVAGTGCRTAPLGAAPPSLTPAHGTIAGSVEAVLSGAPVENCLVEAVEVETGRRYTDRTGPAGHYSFFVPPGRYRVSVIRTPGDELREQPSRIVEVSPSRLVRGLDFVVGETALAAR